MSGHHFGWGDSECKFNPVISRDRLDEVEHILGCELPPRYRYFISEIGNGGAGPGAGLLPLDLNDIEIDRASAPFPFSESFFEIDDKLNPLHPPDELSKWMDCADQGSIKISDYGCGCFARLVLTGEFAGEVWFSDWPSDGGFTRFGNSMAIHDENAVNSDRPVDFWEWYFSWLDGLEKKVELEE